MTNSNILIYQSEDGHTETEIMWKFDMSHCHTSNTPTLLLLQLIKINFGLPHASE